jgi:hypothetical protein
MAKNAEAKMETAAVKTNEANLEELNRKIVEIKRKIVLSGESFISSLTPSTFLTFPRLPQLLCLVIRHEIKSFSFHIFLSNTLL